MNWPEIFKSRRVSMRLSMQDMALLLGVTRQTVWNVETGATLPSLTLVMVLAKISGPITIATEAEIESQDQESVPKIEITSEIEK